MFGNNSPSLADIAAVTDNNRNNGAWGMDGMMSGAVNAMDKNFCQTNWNMAQMGRDNANFRSLEATVRDGFQSLKEQGYIQEIQGLRQALNDCNAANLAQATARQVVNEIRPCPVPSYEVPNPYCNCGYSDCGPRRC